MRINRANRAYDAELVRIRDLAELARFDKSKARNRIRGLIQTATLNGDILKERKYKDLKKFLGL